MTPEAQPERPPGDPERPEDPEQRHDEAVARARHAAVGERLVERRRCAARGVHASPRLGPVAGRLRGRESRVIEPGRADVRDEPREIVAGHQRAGLVGQLEPVDEHVPAALRGDGHAEQHGERAREIDLLEALRLFSPRNDPGAIREQRRAPLDRRVRAVGARVGRAVITGHEDRGVRRDRAEQRVEQLVERAQMGAVTRRGGAVRVGLVIRRDEVKHREMGARRLLQEGVRGLEDLGVEVDLDAHAVGIRVLPIPAVAVHLEPGSIARERGHQAGALHVADEVVVLHRAPGLVVDDLIDVAALPGRVGEHRRGRHRHRARPDLAARARGHTRGEARHHLRVLRELVAKAVDDHEREAAGERLRDGRTRRHVRWRARGDHQLDARGREARREQDDEHEQRDRPRDRAMK